MTVQSAVQWLSSHRRQKTVVLVTGVFDLFHKEHKLFLQRAKELGDILVVGVESDLRVRQLKGENRPIWNEEQRVSAIMKTKIADVVFVLPQKFSRPSDHEALIERIKPNFLAISSHTPHQSEKQSIIEKFGGQLVIVHQHNPKVSTTLTVERVNTK